MKPTWKNDAAGVQLFRADCRDVAGQLSGVAAVVTDPPYGLAPGRKSRGGFMGHAWDRDVPPADLWADLLAACLPGAPLFAFGAPRTYHRLATRVEDAGWQICNQLCWLYGTGFAKAQLSGGYAAGLASLKPAAEPICYAQRRPDGSWKQNAERHGVAGLWIDGCRIGTESTVRKQTAGPQWSGQYRGGCRLNGSDSGRWPANVVHDGSAEVLQAFGDRPPAESPARFFYCAKASKAEKTSGGRVANGHDTVKPLALMRWLIRLTRQAGLPAGGVVLDPFAGSGTTAVAAVAEGRPVIACERDPESFRTMQQRVRLALQDRAPQRKAA